MHPLNSALYPLPSEFPSKSGQSIIEFCIGLVGILTVIAGVFQLGLLGMGRTRARVQATRIATERSMMAESVSGVFVPQYIYQMDAGRDGYSYSVDDRAITSNPDEAYDRLVRPMAPNQMRMYSPRSEVSQMRDSTDMMMAMGLVPGTGRTNGIPVLPVVRRLFFNRQSVDIDVRVWSTRTGDIY
ncbi:MAG: hypothetical protein JJU05_12965 [Verrucomicrobia bacterium]|nr:hypothetical protein [Verrucomicrobiota bacterium]MCH8528479.1 hypothetical protein [Kiritimatiellia bacterium]